MSSDPTALSRYFNRQDITRGAKWESEAAGFRLAICRMQERLAEIESQHQPLQNLMDSDLGMREKIMAAAHYVVNGRFHERFGYKELK